VDKTITTAFLIVASVVTAVMVFNAVFPAIGQSSDAMLRMKTRLDERLRSQIEIIHATGELDSNGLWQDTNSNGQFDVFAWIKNIGSVRISAIERVDVFFGVEGNFARIPHRSEAGGSYPFWDGVVENGSEWTPSSTLKITIYHSSVLSSGRYFIKVVTPNGLMDDYFFGM
jgi:archaellum component FlaG (FlaF/FlaG flagellin family)